MGGKEQGKNRHNIAHGIHRDYTMEALRLFDSGEKWFDDFYMGNNELIEPYKKAFKVFEEPSYGWVFKPFVIATALRQADEGDLVMWNDSNHLIAQNPQFFFDYAVNHNGIFTWSHWGEPVKTGNFTHRDTFVQMGCDSERYYLSDMMQVNTMVFIKNNYASALVEEWLSWCLDYDTIITNGLKNLPTYVDHRHEQSIWSILIEKYNFPYYHRIFDTEFIVVEGNTINA
jgi:hypothetical protein